MTMRRVGQWDVANALTSNLKRDLKRARDISLKRFVLIGEKIVLGHMAKQDLNWEPLSDKYKSWKEKKGYSNKILIRTSTYFQAITGWVNDGTALIGVKRNVQNEEGEEIANIAKIHEYGSDARNIQARPLWGPSWKEARTEWFKADTPIQTYFRLFTSQYKIGGK